jgi:hypothetical protein
MSVPMPNDASIAAGAKITNPAILEADPRRAPRRDSSPMGGNIAPMILSFACFRLLFTGEGRVADMVDGVPASPGARRGRVAPGGWQAAPRQASLVR